MYGKTDFEVKVTKTEVVAAALPMQDHWLPLSNLDLLLPPVDVGIFFCYGGCAAAAAAGVLKKALAQALVSYYAFGGELVKNGAGEPELLCNNRGVDFSEARADVALEELDFHRPDESVDGKLVPVRRRGVLAVQVTHLNRGGLVVACTFAHQVADAHSANMFLISWAEMARSEPLSQPPSFRRSLLLPRRPGRYHLSVDHILAAPDIASYFGNVLSIPFGEKRIRDLRRKSLNWVADEVHAFLQAALSKEHFLGLIDWVEEHRPEPGLSRIYAAPATAEEPAVVVSSGQHFPVSKVDFGWGPPAFGSYHFPWGGKSGYVMPMPGPKGNGDWIVYMHLLKEQLDLIETNAGHVFVPLSSDYIFSC
ncbi:HXXXD-type acyl-transferase family protein [Striga hermonthica]|uniref:HXXXD-type acyl-transferase family protein n=1 Tax=Striga hermonthica TaxID=68872 RepID=A0A9N7NB54_STRHE|nr:HXXXD-type acyl-transferase family protein [Striga hermonthica]